MQFPPGAHGHVPPRSARAARCFPAFALPLCLLLLPAAPLAAQDRPEGLDEAVDRAGASSYLPLGHWVYPILDYWIASGRAEHLSPFVRPYRRIDVARAIAEANAHGDPGVSDEWLGRLRREFEPELRALEVVYVMPLPVVPAPGPYGPSGDGSPLAAGGLPRGSSADDRVSLHATGGATYYRQTHRDLLRPALEGPFSDAELLEEVFVHASAQAGAVAGALRAGRNKIYTNDAQFPGGRVVPFTEFPILDETALRVEEGYAEFQAPYFRLFFGRMYRNWGPPGLHGFLRSDYAYSEEEIGYRFGIDRLYIIGSFASYSDYRGDTTHYVSMHRLEARPWDDFVVAVSEAAVHGGPSENLDFRLINPIAIWQFARADGDPPHNKLGQLDLWWRASDGLALYGSLLADATNENQSCCQIGGSLGFELSRLAPGLLVRANLTAIQSLAYRTSLPWEEYSVENIGLGWDKTDLYLATLEADWFGPAGLRLSPRLDVQVKGEGDLRRLRPPAETLDTFPRILSGNAEATVRPALAGAWRSTSEFPVALEWDFGISFIRDYAHAEGDDRTEFVGTLRAVIETPQLGIDID